MFPMTATAFEQFFVLFDIDEKLFPTAVNPAEKYAPKIKGFTWKGWKAEVRETNQSIIGKFLPDRFDKNAHLSVKLNETIATSNLPAQKNLQIKVAEIAVKQGAKKIIVVNAEGKKISEYNFNLQKK